MEGVNAYGQPDHKISVFFMPTLVLLPMVALCCLTCCIVVVVLLSTFDGGAARQGCAVCCDLVL